MQRLVINGCVAALLALSVVAVRADVVIIDDEDAGYGTTGGWTRETAGAAYNDDDWWQSSPNNGATATWSFTNLVNGKYCVAASWTTNPNRTPAALYTVNGTDTYAINQQLASSFGFDDNIQSVGYARLSDFKGYYPVTVMDGRVEVTVAHATAGFYLMADSVRVEKVMPDVEKIYIIDSEDAIGYSEHGTWETWNNDAYDHRSGMRYVGNGSTTNSATFAFTGLDDGAYRVSACWTVGGGRPNDAAYMIAGAGSVTVNQQLQPRDGLFEDSYWQYVFAQVDVTGGSLSVVVTNLPGGSGTVLIADAVRLEKIDPDYLFDFELVENFESHAAGSQVVSTNGWSGTTNAVVVSENGNHVAQLLSSGNLRCSKGLGAHTIFEGFTGTLFMQVRSETADIFNFGSYLTDWNGGGNWWDYDDAGIFGRSSDFGGRTVIRPRWDAGNLQDIVGERWYNVWVVANNGGNTFDVYISQGYDSATGGVSSVTVDTGVAFGGTGGDLDFFMFLGTQSIAGKGGRIDNIYLARGVNLEVPEPLKPVVIEYPKGTIILIQ